MFESLLSFVIPMGGIIWGLFGFVFLIGWLGYKYKSKKVIMLPDDGPEKHIDFSDWDDDEGPTVKE